jgi:DNA-binding response OmpR family regulator
MSAGSRVVLVVEDEKDLRDFADFVLRRAGYQVLLAGDGKSALDVLAQASPDVILFDLKMPVMSGCEFAAEYRRRFGSRTRMIVMTAADDARQRADEIGVQELLVKPFGMRELVSAVALQST